MGVRLDLLEVAEHLAGEARRLVAMRATALGAGPIDDDVVEINGVKFREANQRIADLAAGAKAALEAAALVDVEGPPVLAALERLVARMNATGVQATLEIAGPESAIDMVTEILVVMERDVRVGARVQEGYVLLRELAESLMRDFEAAGSPVSARLAARVRSVLEQAEESIKAAQAAEPNGET